jgi:hypothetical protein
VPIPLLLLPPLLPLLLLVVVVSDVLTLHSRVNLIRKACNANISSSIRT